MRAVTCTEGRLEVAEVVNPEPREGQVPTEQEMAEASPEEQQMLAEARYYGEVLSGYAKQMSTRPQTIGYSLADSPAGLAAWIYAMFQDVSASRGDAEAVFSLDEILDDVMLYWLPNAGASAARVYWEMAQGRWSPPADVDSPITVPVGITIMPREYVRKPRRWAERRYTDLVHFEEIAAGGHFAVLEQPAALTEQIRAAFRHAR
jgi:microsomal epoxide hydrolase